MKRREFLTRASAAAAVTAATGCAAAGAAIEGAQPAAAQQGRNPKLDRVAIMSLSFASILKSPDDPANPARVLDVMDLPRMYVDRYGVHNIEMQHSHFDSTEPEYLRAFLNRVQDAKCRISQINAASWGSSLGPFFNLSIPGYTRVHLIDITKRWIDHAVMLGCPRLMMHQGPLPPEVRQMAIETLKPLARYGASRGVMVTLENSGGGMNWEATAEIVKAAGIYTTPDLGNFSDQDNQLRGIRALFPMNSGNAHVKLNPARYDLPTALRLTKELGYNGLFSIEAGSNVDPDPYVSVQKILDVLLANI